MINFKHYWEDRHQQKGLQAVGNAKFSESDFFNNFDFLEEKFTPILKKYLVNKKVLDFGCGWGRWSRVLNLFCDIYGTDLSAEAITQLHRLKSDLGLNSANFLTYNEKIPFEIKFTGIFCWTVLQHIPPLELMKIVEELNGVSDEKCTLVLFENTSNLPSKEHIFFHPVSYYEKIFEEFQLLYSEIFQKIDGENDLEIHSLMIFEKKLRT